jgi:hypothetical protein
MIVIDKILNEWSFRCHDGVVNLNDPIKLSILHEIVNEYELEESMLSLKSVKKRPQQFAKKFYKNEPFKVGKDGDSEIVIDVVVVVDEEFFPNKPEEESNLMGALRAVASARDVKLVGHINGQETTISLGALYKSGDLGGQEGGSRGVSNENELIDGINNAIEQNGNDPITIKFVAVKKGPEIIVNGVERAENMGYSGKKDGLKGDVILFSVEKDQNISVKKDGSYWWSSERKQFGDLLDKFVTQGREGKINNLIIKQNPLQDYVYDMMDPRDDTKYGQVLILNYPKVKENLENITFGPDKAKIVQRSFTLDDFSFEGDTLVIKTTRNMNGVEDLEEGDMPVIWLARHENQKYGIDFRTLPLKQINQEPKRGKILVIDYNSTPALQ